MEIIVDDDDGKIILGDEKYPQISMWFIDNGCYPCIIH